MNGDGTDIPLDQYKSMYFGQGAAPAQQPPQPQQDMSIADYKQRFRGIQQPSEEQAIGNLQRIVNQPKSWLTTGGEIGVPTGTGMAGGALGGTLGAAVGFPKAGARVGAGLGQTVGEELVQVIERHMRGQEAFPGEAERFLKRAGINIALNTFIEHYFPALKSSIKYQLGGKSAEKALDEVYGLGAEKAAQAGQLAERTEQSVAARLAKMTEQEAGKVEPGARLEQIAAETGRTPETAAATQMTAQPEPTQVGEHLQYQAPTNFGIDFSQPQAPQQVYQWAQSASPEDKLAMKEMLGDHFASAPNRLATNDPTQANMWAQAWRSIDPKSKFANPDNILFVNGKLNALMSSPENYQRFLEGAGKKAMPIFDEGARAELAASRKALQDLGPLGKETLRQIDAAAAEGPQAQALIARKYLQSLDRPGMAQQIAEQSTRFGRSVPEQVLKAAGRTEPPSGAYLPRGMSRAARPGALPWLIASGGVSLATGHAPYFLTGLLAYGGYQAGKRALTNSLIKEMTQRVAGQGLGTVTEEAAAAAIIKSIGGAYGDAAMSNLSNEAYESLGSVVFQHMTADVSKKTAETYGSKAYATTKQEFGPMVKDIGRTVAKNIASPERRIDSGHIDNVQKVNEQVQSGKNPDIQRDLNSGRLSTAEARRMVEKSGTDPGSMFKGMTLNEAIDAYVKGTDDEKSLALAPLAQKLNDEGRNLPPAQRRALLAQIRNALPQGEESLPGPGEVAQGGT